MRAKLLHHRNQFGPLAPANAKRERFEMTRGCAGRPAQVIKTVVQTRCVTLTRYVVLRLAACPVISVPRCAQVGVSKSRWSHFRCGRVACAKGASPLECSLTAWRTLFWRATLDAPPRSRPIAKTPTSRLGPHSSAHALGPKRFTGLNRPLDS